MSEKCQKFIAALEALCLEHRVQLAVSGEDPLQVWDWEDGMESIHTPDIEDMLTWQLGREWASGERIQ